MNADELAWDVASSESSREAAFEQLLSNHERPILRLCYRLLGNLSDAEDAAQDVFLKAYRNLHRLQSGRSAGPWLYQIAVNTCRDRWRSRRREVPLPDGSECRPADSPEAIARGEQLRERVLSGLGRLPERERLAFVLREMEGLGTREVAAILGVDEGTVRSQVWQARARLRDLLAWTKGTL